MQLEDECRAEPEPAQCHPGALDHVQSFAESTPEEVTRTRRTKNADSTPRPRAVDLELLTELEALTPRGSAWP
eukprot:scaffold123058_cov72-Phaeocystis_antarctica.AAC.1